MTGCDSDPYSSCANGVIVTVSATHKLNWGGSSGQWNGNLGNRNSGRLGRRVLYKCVPRVKVLGGFLGISDNFCA